MKRGSVTKKNSYLVAVLLGNELLSLLDIGVQREDSDRSKFIRAAVRDKVRVMGLYKSPEGTAPESK